MILALILSAIAMTLIVGVRYLIVSGAFAWASGRRHPGLYRGVAGQMTRQISGSRATAPKVSSRW